MNRIVLLASSAKGSELLEMQLRMLFPECEITVVKRERPRARASSGDEGAIPRSRDPKSSSGTMCINIDQGYGHQALRKTKEAS